MAEQSCIERARAKVNLTLHVGAPRPDGYHPLESLVLFADVGDVLSVTRAPRSSLTIDGPYAGQLEASDDNLILRAARCIGLSAEFHLTKNLPVASGLGGGSADAAAALRGLMKAHGPQHSPSKAALLDMALSLGADVPICLFSETAIMRGIGEDITPIVGAPKFAALLVNPNKAVSTAAIFNAFDARLQGGGVTKDLAHDSEASVIDMALAGRNDLQDIAVDIVPDIARVLEVIGAQDGVTLARMSGSGASCFGLFESYAKAQQAQAVIARDHPSWWCEATWLGGAEL